MRCHSISNLNLISKITTHTWAKAPTSMIKLKQPLIMMCQIITRRHLLWRVSQIILKTVHNPELKNKIFTLWKILMLGMIKINRENQVNMLNNPKILYMMNKILKMHIRITNLSKIQYTVVKWIKKVKNNLMLPEEKLILKMIKRTQWLIIWINGGRKLDRVTRFLRKMTSIMQAMQILKWETNEKSRKN